MKESEIDLHVHSTYSKDTKFSPNEILEEAMQNGVKVISFTDYNTIEYYKETNIRRYQHVGDALILCGVEIMCQNFWEVLGYCFDPYGPISELLGKWHDNLDNLLKISLKSTMNIERVKLDFNRYDMSILDKSDDESMQAIWDKAESCRPSVQKAIEVIKQSHGLSFIAHPISVWDLVFKKDNSKMHKSLSHLKEVGLDGLEVYQPRMYEENTEVEEFREWLKEIANELGFLVSKGSEFHSKDITYSQWISKHKKIITDTTGELDWIRSVCQL